MRRLALARVARGSFTWTLVANVSAQCLGLITGVLLARRLSVADRGVLLTAMTWAQVAAWVGALSAPAWVTRASASDDRDPRSVLASALRLAVPSTVLAAAAAACAAALSTGARAVAVAAFVVCAAPLVVVLDLCIAQALGQHHVRLYNAMRLAQPLVYTCLLVGLVVVAGGSFDSTSAMLAYVVALLLVAGVAVRVLGPLWRFASRDPARDLQAFARQTHGGTLIAILNTRLDALLVTAALPGRSAGVYAIALTFAAALGAVAQVVPSFALTRFSSGLDTSTRRLVSVLSLSMTIAGVAALVLAATAPWAITFVFGDRYIAAVEPALALLVAGVLQAGVVTLAAYSMAHGRGRVIFLAQVCGVVGAAPVYYFGLRELGALGAAAGSVTSSAVALVVLMLILVTRERRL